MATSVQRDADDWKQLAAEYNYMLGSSDCPEETKRIRGVIGFCDDFRQLFPEGQEPDENTRLLGSLLDEFRKQLMRPESDEPTPGPENLDFAQIAVVVP